MHLANAQIIIDKVTPILDASGKPVTGLSNGVNDDLPYLKLASTTPLPYNVNGLDTEEVEPLPSGDFLISEEYAPSVAVIGADGKVKVRVAPSGVTLAGAAYPVKSILPPVLTNRRSNKGFESLAVSPDGATAFVALQTPMGDDKDARYATSRVVRLLRLDLSNRAAPAVTGHFLVLMSPAADYPADNKQKDILFSAAKWLTQDKLVLLERASGKVKLFLVDLKSATNLSGAAPENTLDPEDTQTPGKGYMALGLTPATSTEIFSSDDTKEILQGDGTTPGTDKIEGLAILDKATIALANDNDFGITNPLDRSRVWIVRLAQLLP